MTRTWGDYLVDILTAATAGIRFYLDENLPVAIAKKTGFSRFGLTAADLNPPEPAGLI